MNIACQLLIECAGTILGIVAVLWIERQRRPNLEMRVEEVPPKQEDEDPGAKGTFLRIEVHNKEIPRWIARFYDGEPALSCHASIVFYHLDDGRRACSEKMPVRWVDTDEPECDVRYLADGTAVDVLRKVQHTVDIPSGECAKMDVAFRQGDHTKCYGWNNEGYLYGKSNPKWTLDKGQYVAKVTMKTGGRLFANAFVIDNDGRYEDFKLRAADAGNEETSGLEQLLRP